MLKKQNQAVAVKSMLKNPTVPYILVAGLVSSACDHA